MIKCNCEMCVGVRRVGEKVADLVISILNYSCYPTGDIKFSEEKNS